MYPNLSPAEISRYARHIVIPEIGRDGQQKLKAASVLVVGMGGLGSPIALYLAAAGIGRIGLVDYDVVDSTNLQRQIIHTQSDVNSLKVLSAKKSIELINPDIQIDAYNLVFSSENAIDIAESYQVLLDGTDNFSTRYLLNDLAFLTGKPYVYGSVYRFEGQISVFDGRRGPCYRCLFPEPPPPGTIPMCAQSGVLGVLPGTIGTLQATEAIKLILGIGDPLIGRLLLFDALNITFHEIAVKNNPNCNLCGNHPTIVDLLQYADYCGESIGTNNNQLAGAEWDLSPLQLKSIIAEGKRIKLVDVRSPHERNITEIEDSIFIPLEELPNRMNELDRNDRIVFLCRTGVRSARAVQILVKEGYQDVHNLVGGTNAWADQIDGNIITY